MWCKEESTSKASGCACLCAAKQSASTLNCKHIFYVTYRHFSLYWKSVYKAEHPSPSINCKTILPPHNLIQPPPILCSYLLQPIQISSIRSCAFNNDFFFRETHLLFSPCPKRHEINQYLCELPTWGFSLWGPTYFYLRAARETGPHHRHNRFWGEATGVSKAEGHRSVLTLFLTPCPNPFHPSPSAPRWPPLTPTQRPPRPPPHREGTHQPHSLPQAEGTPLRPKPLTSTRTRAPGSPGGGRGWREPGPPQQLPPPRKRREAGRAAQKEGGACALTGAVGPRERYLWRRPGASCIKLI